MPIYSLPLTLAELLEVQGTALNDSELWALLYATSKSLSDLFSQGTVAFVIMSVETLSLGCHIHNGNYLTLSLTLTITLTLLTLTAGASILWGE